MVFNARFHGWNKFLLAGNSFIQTFEKTDDVNAAGQAAGWLLKKVIDRDKRHFETKKEERIRKYKWVGDEK